MNKTKELVNYCRNEDIYDEILSKIRELTPAYQEAPEEALRKSFDMVIEALIHFWEQDDDKLINEWAQMRAKMSAELQFLPSAVIKALDLWARAIQNHLEQDITPKDLLRVLIDQLKEGMSLLRYHYMDAHHITLKKTQKDLTRQTAMIEAVNRMFQKALTCESDVDVAEVCLNVAEELTGSQFGYIGELNQAGRFDTIAMSNPRWETCQMPESEATVLIKDMKLSSFWGEIITKGQSQIVNDPISHSKSSGTPKGHPPITSFLGVPLKRGETTIGLIGLANKEGGYELADQQAIDTLSIAFVQAVDRKRIEKKLEKHRDHLEELVDDRTSELIKTQEELQQQKDWLEVTLSSIGDAVIATDTNANIVLINPVAEDLTGWTAQEALGHNIGKVFRIINEQTRQPVENPVDRVLKEGLVVGLANHTVLIAQDGREIPIDDSGAPIQTIDGTTLGVVLVFHNITERKRAEEELRYHAMLVENVSDAIISTDEQFFIRSWNKTAGTMYGWQLNEVIGKPLNDILQAEYPHTTSEEVQRQLLSGRWTGEAIHKRKDGDSFYVLASASLLKDTQSNIVGAVTIISDITEQEERKERLKKYSEQLEEMVELRTKELQDVQNELEIILDNVPGLIFYKDTENNFIRVNKVIADAHNMTKEEMVGKSLFDLYPNVEAQAYWDDDLEVIKSGKPKLNIEEPWDRPEGRSWVNSSKIPFKDEKGDIIGIVGFSTDITERKKMEEELRRKEKLAILGQLAGGVGHELRNPLGAIKSAAFFLNMTLEEAESEVKESLKIIEEEVLTSERIISSLLDFARPKPLHVRKITINEVIQKAQAYISISEKIKVVTSLDKRISVILVDPDQLIQVFKNIISNAIQAMPKGGQLVIKSELKKSKWVVISFADTGEGISNENMEKLFEPLFTTRAKGIGLGLAVSKTFVEAHGGKIEVDSKVGKGTTFNVILPMKRYEEEVE